MYRHVASFYHHQMFCQSKFLTVILTILYTNHFTALPWETMVISISQNIDQDTRDQVLVIFKLSHQSSSKIL